MKLKETQKAPDFTLPDQNGASHSLSDYKGSWVLLYFYPKDNTSGCTKEACTIRDNFSEFKKLKIQILGVSKDSIQSHYKFAQKYELPFILLSDESKKVIKLYNVWGKKKLYGREYEGTMRTSYLIDPDGKIARIYEKVQPGLHADQVLNDIKTLKN